MKVFCFRSMPFGKAFLCLSIAILFVQCQRDDSSEVDIQDQTNDGLTISKLEYDSQNILRDFSFTYSTPNKNQFVKMKSSVDENNQLNSVLLVSVNGKKWTRINEVSLDLSKEDYKKTANFMIEDLANSLKEKYDAKTITEYERILNELPELLFDEQLGWEKEFNNNTAFSIFYHLSTFRSAKRAYAMDLDDCNCSINELYVGDKTPFVCSEDKLVSVAELLELFNGERVRTNFYGRKFIPTETVEYLKQSKKEYVLGNDVDLILYKELKSFWTETLTEKQRRNFLLELEDIDSENSLGHDTKTMPRGFMCEYYNVVYGKDCGCCANYSGRCYVCSSVCYAHDVYCMNCDKPWYVCWFCNPGCPNFIDA